MKPSQQAIEAAEKIHWNRGRKLDAYEQEEQHRTATIIQAAIDEAVGALHLAWHNETKRMDFLECLVFTNREGDYELHFDFTMPLREAIDARLKAEFRPAQKKPHFQLAELDDGESQ